MQSDNSSGSSSASSTLDSPQGTKPKTKENLYRKFFKTSTGNKLLRQGQSPSISAETNCNDEKENEKTKARSSKILKGQNTNARSVSETRNHTSASSSTPAFPILSGRQIYPQTQKVETAQLVKVRTGQFRMYHAL